MAPIEPNLTPDIKSEIREAPPGTGHPHPLHLAVDSLDPAREPIVSAGFRMKSTGEVFREFLGLGLTSFGGPTAHIAFFRDRFVGARKWLSESEFADLLALCQFLPGPASSQLGLAIGWRRAGLPGALAAWVGFTLPSAIVLVIFGLGVINAASATPTTANEGWLRGLQIAVVIVIAKALASMGNSLCPRRPHQLIALATTAFMVVSESAQMQLAAIAGGAVLGMLFLRPQGMGTHSPGEREGSESLPPLASGFSSSRWFGGLCLALFFALLFGLPALVHVFPESLALSAFQAMYRSGSLVFGGGHVVLPLLSQEVVSPGWISAQDFLAGYGATQAVPGPLFTFSAYLGSLLEGPGGPWGMAAICLVGIFLPAWLLVLGCLPFWHRMVQRPLLRSALVGTNAAVVGLLAAALYDPVWTSAIQSNRDFVFLLGVITAYLVLRIPVWAVVIAAATAGWLLM